MYKKSFNTIWSEYTGHEAKLIKESVKIKAGNYKFVVYMHIDGSDIIIQFLPNHALKVNEYAEYGENFATYIQKKLKAKDARYDPRSPAAGINIKVPKYEWQKLIEKMIK